MRGRNQVHPSPQRAPVLFQAGASKTGMDFAAKHAECIFIGGMLPEQCAKQVRDTTAAAAAMGRDPSALKFFTGITPFIGKTLEEAKAKYDVALENADLMEGLAQVAAITGIMKNFSKTDIVWTPRKVGLKMALGFHPCPVGTSKLIADVMEEWSEVADVDGFLIAYVTNPASFEDVVYILRPELVRRGLMWGDYEVPGGTFRKNLYGQGQMNLRDDHHGNGSKPFANDPALYFYSSISHFDAQREPRPHNSHTDNDQPSYARRHASICPEAGPIQRFDGPKNSTSTRSGSQQTKTADCKALPDARADHGINLCEHAEAHGRQRNDNSAEEPGTTL
ncbi:xenobiotic compound family [Seiridium cupressi]